MRKNLNKALAWTLAFALAFPTQAVAAMPASQGTETSDSTGQEAQSDGSGTAENSGQSGENDSSSGQEGSTDTGSSGTEDGSGGSSGEEEGSGTESGSGTENGSGDGSEEEEGSGTESGSDTEDGSETGSGEEEGSGTESGSGTEEGSETGSGEEEGAESGDTENGSGTDTGDADTGEAGSGDADTGDAGEDSGTGQGDNTTDASEEAPADGETESGSADDESAAEEIPEDTDVVLVEEPETPAETEETKAAEKKENESETYTVVYEVDPEDGATVKGDDEVKEGKDLTFKVTPEDGYKIESVSVNGEEVTDNKEKKSFLFFFGDTYYEYKVTDVEEDLSVEILMAEDILRASDGDTEVEIEADDKNALRDVSYVEISELGEDDSIEAAIKEQLSEKQIVDYKAVDITLYDKDGNVAEPDGDVSVRISGVETDEDYDEVFIYHLEEEETAQATSRMGAMPAVNAVSDEEDSVSYTAKEVKSGVEDAIEDEGMIRFTADAFSPYVVVFVKDGNEEVSFHLQDMDGRELKTDAFNVDAVSVGGDNINIRSFVEGNDLLQIVPDGEDETYIFQYATTDEEGNDKSEMIVYDDIGEDEAIYLWYEAVSSQSLNVKAHLYNASGQDISGSPFDVEIPAGEISDEKMREVLSSIEGDTEGFVPDNAEVQDDEGKKEEIKSAFKSGESIYVVKNDNRQMILGQDQSIYLNYRSGNDIIINVQGTDGNDDNAIVIDGNDRTGDGSFTTQYVKGSNTTLAIPVKIAQGYNVKITKGNDTVYDSFQDATQARYYTLTIAEQDFGQDNSLSYTVAYTWDGLTFDFSYVIQNNANGNHDPFHGSEVWIGKTADDLGSKPYDDGGYPRPTDTEYPITDNTFVVKFVTDGDYEWGKLEYMMDSFAINSQNVNVPNDDMTAETEILDQAGQTIANLTISCEPARNDQKGKYRIYIFTFTNVTGDLEVTGGNFKSTVNYEVVYSTKTEGVSSVERRDGRDYETWNIGTQTGLSDGNPVTFRITPEDGYYISGVKVTSEDGTRDEELQNASGSKWYGQRTARISYDENRRLNMLGVEASPIQYRFVYRNADNETEHTSVNTFVLTDKSQIPPVTDALMYVPQEATLPDGRVFAGWQLREQADDAVNADYYENGSVILASEIFSLEEYRIETDWSGFPWESSEEKGTIDYADEPEIADIILVPYYVDDVNAVKYPVTVEIFSPDNTTGEQVNLTVSKDSVMTIDAVQSYPAVREITAALEAKGYQLDPAQSTTTLTVSNSHGNTFEIYYTDKPVEITAAFAESSLGGEIDVAGGNYNVTPGTSVQLFGAIGEDITFEITPPRGYTIEKIQVNGTTEVENPDLTDGSYSFTYQVNKEDISKDHQIRIEVSLKQSSVAYSINYTYDGTSGSAPAGAITQGTGEFNAQIDLSDKVGTEELPSTVDHDGVNYMLDPGNGYTLTLSDPEGNNELTVNYVKDENEDGTPDSSQITVVFDLDDAAGERHGAAFTGVTVDGKTVILNEAEGTITFWLTKESGSYPAAPGVDIDYATEGYAFDGWTPVYTLTGTVPEEASSQIFQAVYAEDEVGGKDDNGGDEGDGIPDKYQVKVTYTVVNGYWNEGENDNADQVVYVTLQTNGTASVDGTATAQASAPGVGEKPLPGYAANSGEWTPSLNTEITIADQADGVEYTYSYELRSDVAYSVNYTYDGASGSAPAGAITQGTGEFNAQIDLSDKVGTEELPSTVDHDGVNYMLDPGNGYTLTLSDPEGNNELTVNYVKDENEDGTPDSSQITVVFDLDDAAGERHGAAFTGVTVDGKTVILNEAEGTITFWLTKESGSYPAAPGVDIDYATEGYAFDGWTPVYALTGTVPEEASSQIFQAVYAEDEVGGKDDNGGDEGDGIPDKYQVKVTYTVVNGYWNEGENDNADQVVYVTLQTNGTASVDGTATAQASAPGVGEKPLPGYAANSGEWTPSLNTEITIADQADGVEYTYSYELRSDVAYSVNYTYDGASGSAPAGAITQGTGEFNAQIDLSDKVGTEELPSTVDRDGVNYMLDPGNGYTLTLSDPEGNNELTVNYVKDENEDGTPDSSQITVVFDLDDAAGERHGAAFTGVTVDGKTVILNEAEGTITFWLTKGSDIYPAAPGVDIDYATEGYAFDGWYSVDTEYAGGQTVEESAVSQIYNAVYAEDNIGGTDEDGNDEGDGTPDKYQIKVRFKVLNGSFTDPMTAADPEAARLDGIRTIVVTLRDDSEEWSEEGSYLLSEADIPDIYPFDGFIAGAWDPELTDENRVIDAKDVTGDVREVWFLHTCVPGEGEFVDITFNAGENGTFEDEQKTLVFKVKTNDAFPEIPTPVGNETEDGKWIFTGWTDEAGNPVETFPETAGSTASYTAVYGFDGNNDNVPDESQLQAMIRPYDTTIYTGGDSAAGGGFPETELEVVIEDENGTVTEERPIQAESIESITINGYTFEGDAADVHSLFKVIYWNDASGWVENDQEDGHYTASLVFTNEAQPAFPESSTNDTGRLEGVLSDADGNPIPVKGADIGIEADYSGASGVQTMAENDADTTSYVVNADTGNLIVRKVEDMDANGATTEAVYRDVLASPEGIDPNGERATAVIPDGAEFYINGNEIRANSDRSGIKLLTDHIYNEANKENLLVERAFREAYGETGINAGNAAERGYGYVLRYYDLVDSENGNAWVESSKGVDVYIPYQAGTDINTAFEIRHFIGLHRETGITEAEVPEAIATCTLDDMGGSEAVKNTEQGIMFHTEGDQAFSPFIIMWKLDDNTGDNTPGDNTGGNGGDSDSDGGSSSPGAGPGASGSTYTAGVDGHWVHMDPDNIMIPISEDVPEGATPVTAPQWHQWKFILNNGMMLYDQWAYVKNPYAIGDQPDEGWFSFAENGIMEYGWYLDERTGKWYWMHRTSDGMLGTMLTGWHFDEQDGKWYYMSPRSGEMLLGWQEIDGKWYYFNPYAPAVTWEFNEATGGWTYNGANSRPYGSMYANETTPDGYTVGEDGAWIQ